MLNQLDELSAKDRAEAAKREPAGQPPLVSFVWLCRPWTKDELATARHYLRMIDGFDRPSELVIVASEHESGMMERLTSGLHSSHTPISFVRFSHTCGESKAFRIGFERTAGEFIVVLPSSAESDPEDVRRVLDALENGLDYVASVRRPRIDGWHRRQRSALYNWCVWLLCGVRLRDINSGLCAMRREVVESLPLYGDLHLFLPVLAARQGFRIGELPVHHKKEHFGKGPYNIMGYLQRMLDLLTLFFLTRFTEKPFRLFGALGAALTTAGSVIAATMVIQRILGQPLANRPGLILAIFAVVIGIQLLSLGFLAELIIYVDATNTKHRRVQHIYEHPARTVKRGERHDCV